MIQFDKYKEYLKNYKILYLVLGGIFIIWMTFFDAENWISYYKLRRKLSTLSKERDYYIEQKSLIEKEREKINGEIALLEKFAREKYLMKRKSEDIYVIKKSR